MMTPKADILERLDYLSEQIAGSVIGGPMLIAEAIREISGLRAVQIAERIAERERCAAIADLYASQARPLGDENCGDCPVTAYYYGQKIVAQNISHDIRSGA